MAAISVEAGQGAEQQSDMGRVRFMDPSQKPSRFLMLLLGAFNIHVPYLFQSQARSPKTHVPALLQARCHEYSDSHTVTVQKASR